MVTTRATGALSMMSNTKLRWRIEHALRVEGVPELNPSRGLPNPAAQQVLQRILDEVEEHVRELLVDIPVECELELVPTTTLENEIMTAVREELQPSPDRLADLLEDLNTTMEPALNLTEEQIQAISKVLADPERFEERCDEVQKRVQNSLETIDESVTSNASKIMKEHLDNLPLE